MRAGELTVPSNQSFDPAVQLSWGNVSVDNPANPVLIGVRLKASKTDLFHKGISLYINKVASDIDLVFTMLAYLLVTGHHTGPQFLFYDGRFLIHQRLVVAVRDALRAA